MRIKSYCRIAAGRVIVNDEPLRIVRTAESDFLTDVYHSAGIAYPKFFKMDLLAKSGFLGAELALRSLGVATDTPKRDTAVVMMNRSSSLEDDTAYQHTIGAADYFPSPAVFVYTLANIVTGEVAIRNKIFGESSFYIAERFSAEALIEVVEGAFTDREVERVVCGWTEAFEGECDTLIMVVERTERSYEKEFNIQNINILYNK